MYNYTKTLIVIDPEKVHNHILTLFNLLGIRSDALWSFSANTQIYSDSSVRQEVGNLATQFHLDLNQARDFYLSCIFGHPQQETSINISYLVSNFWIRLDQEQIAEFIKRKEDMIHKGLENDHRRLEILMQSK